MSGTEAGASRRRQPGAWSRTIPTAIAALVVLICVPLHLHAATRYDPHLRFHSITTPHFVIHYHQGEEALALRLAGIAEAAHPDLVARLRHAPRARTHVVLVDQDDDPNGSTTTLPYNLIEVRAAPPPGNSTLGNTEDWLRTVFTHEYAHVLHLDPARGWARAARHVFGRAFFAFPNLTLPLWQIEGIATFEESRPGQGRLYAGDFQAVVDQGARAGRFEPLDRVNGGLVAWPSGQGWYAYGAFFHEYLATRFGEQKLAELAARTSGRLPYVQSGAFKHVFGESLGALWREFQAAETAGASRTSEAGAPTRITSYGYLTDGPRFEADGRLVFAHRDADGFPTVERIGPGARPERLATRNGGGQVSPGREAIYFDQLELVRNVGLVSDLYRLDRATGRVTRLTRGARLSEPDVSPDGRHIAAIRLGGGDRRLVVLDLTVLESGGPAAARAIDTSVSFGTSGNIMATPRWSPDGTRIAVESRDVHAPSTIVVFRPDEGSSAVVALSGGRTVTPAWTPDGQAIVFAEATAGEPFNLHCTRLVDGGRYTFQLTTLAGGARSPDVSPDGRTVAFVSSTAAGQDIFTIPLSCPQPGPDTIGSIAGSSSSSLDEPAPSVTARGYSPWPTLAPRSWLPIVDTSDDEVRVGAAVGGVDALGYHAWAATATWSVARDPEFEPVAPGARPDVSFSYTHRWRPMFFAQFSDETTPLLVSTDAGVSRPVALREQAADAGVTVAFRRVRFSQAFLGSYRIEHDAVRGPADEGQFDRGALRAGWTLASAKRYGYSISPEGGVAIGLSVEQAASGLGADGNATFLRGDVRAYVPFGPRHAVLALRATGGRTTGDVPVRRVLRLGGSDGDPAVLSFDEEASSLLRGFPSGRFTGSRLALVNTEYRVPIAWIERGIRTWPLFLKNVHATAFADAGDAWRMGGTRLGDWKRSWGGELSTDVVAGFVLPLTLTGGVAWGRDGAGRVPPTRTAYIRVGHAF